MIYWIKNAFDKISHKNQDVNYVVAEYHGTKKKSIKADDPIIAEFDTEKNSTGEYMQIDQLHQKN